MKYLSMIMLILSCSLIGNYFTIRDKKRVRYLEQILLMIQLISSEISYIQSPIDKIIINLTNHSELSDLRFLSDCKAKMEKSLLPESWKESVLQSSFNQRDKELLISLGSNLGTSDIEGQLSNLNLHMALVENYLFEARERSAKFGKLYSTLGVLSGFLIAVLMV